MGDFTITYQQLGRLLRRAGSIERIWYIYNKCWHEATDDDTSSQQVIQLTFCLHLSEHSEGLSPLAKVYYIHNINHYSIYMYLLFTTIYHSLHRNSMPWCLMCRALHRHHAACPVVLVPINLPVLLAIILALCKLDGSQSGQSTSEDWKSHWSPEILAHALSYYNQEMPILWWPSYLANLAKHWWINLWARLLHDWPSRIACGLAHLPKLHWICHVDLWIVSHFLCIQVRSSHVSISYILSSEGPCPNHSRFPSWRLPAWSSTRTLFTLNCFAEPAIGRAGKSGKGSPCKHLLILPAPWLIHG